MKEIKLSATRKHQINYVALVDDEDFEYLNQWKWQRNKNGKYYYAGRIDRIDGVNKPILMHRVIMNTPKGILVDHKDHNGLNNQKENLRNCNYSQNGMNRISCNSCGYLGVYHLDGVPRASIKINGKNIHLGTFRTDEEAAKARDIASIKYFGKFANLNFKQ